MQRRKNKKKNSGIRSFLKFIPYKCLRCPHYEVCNLGYQIHHSNFSGGLKWTKQ